MGTSTAVDAKTYFGDMVRHRLPFRASTQEDRELIDMAFNKKKADNRKEWLRGFVVRLPFFSSPLCEKQLANSIPRTTRQPGTYMDHTVVPVPLCDFINKELILFSMADNIRSIPSMVDGFKPGQRKVLFACFKRKLTKEIKVTPPTLHSSRTRLTLGLFLLVRSPNWRDTSRSNRRTIMEKSVLVERSLDSHNNSWEVITSMCSILMGSSELDFRYVIHLACSSFSRN